MRTMWDGEARGELLARVKRLTPQAKGRWGRMNAPQMVAHLVNSGRMALGELPVRPKNLPIRFPPLRELIIYALPFPRNAPTAPELVDRTPAEWASEQAALLEVMERVAARKGQGFPPHPAFGRLSPHAWGVLLYRHADHHLKQFGV